MASAHQSAERQAAAVETYGAVFADVWAGAQDAAAAGVSPTQLRALTTIERHGKLTISALAAEMGALLSSASRLCDRLQAAGLILRDVGQNDRREVAVSLSRAGGEVLGRLRRHRREEFARILHRMSPAAREALVQGLAAFHAATDESAGEAGDRAVPA